MTTYSVTDLRKKTSLVLADANASGYVHIIQNSKPSVAVVDSKYLAALQEAYEDLLDIQEIDRVKDEPTVTLEEHMKKYRLLHK